MKTWGLQLFGIGKISLEMHTVKSRILNPLKLPNILTAFLFVSVTQAPRQLKAQRNSTQRAEAKSKLASGPSGV